MESKQKHLEMIQSVINRFSMNSFHLKGWCIVLVSALITLSAKERNSIFALIAAIPTIVFWGLDGYYLSAERLFRKLYEKVRNKKESEIDYSMSTLGLNEKKYPWLSATFSKTLIPFYGSILISISILLFLI